MNTPDDRSVSPFDSSSSSSSSSSSDHYHQEQAKCPNRVNAQVSERYHVVFFGV